MYRLTQEIPDNHTDNGHIAKTVAKVIILNWVTNIGAKFDSEIPNNLAKRPDSKKIRVTSYHSQATQMVERFHRQLESALISHSNPNHWTEFLPLVMLGIRTAVKTGSQCLAARLPFEFVNFHTNSKSLI